MSEHGKHSPLMEKLHNFTSSWYLISTVLELFIAVIVTVAVVISILRCIPNVLELLTTDHVAHVFTEYLEELFTIVIGIEFLKMLCHPNSDNILETLIFLVARHMIISTTTPIEDLIATFTIVLLVTVRRYMKNDKHDYQHHPFRKKEQEQNE